MRIALKDIDAAAMGRPESYRDELLSAGTVSGDWLVIKAHVYTKIFAKYRGSAEPFERQIAKAVDKFRSSCPTC